MNSKINKRGVQNMKSKIAAGIVLFSLLAALSLGVVFADNNTTVVKEDVNMTTNLTTNETTNATTNATTNETAPAPAMNETKPA
jgi:hypothetical protein